MRITALLCVLALGASTTPDERAQELVAEMTVDEKVSLLNGVGWVYWDQKEGYYIGNTPAVARLGIPSLNMQDAGQGFRTSDPRMVGEVTSWSCGLGLASTWDRELVAEWASATADEYIAKGANVILGPGLNVHRVARGGRNAEYLSGEDPFLGAALVPFYVKGFQDKGVLTVMKHFGLNNQETNRDTVNSIIIDAQHIYEVYYPPYQAAIEAGVAAAMCSYNVVNGSHACENEQLLQHDLKETMGFDGWVMSDWGAVHSLSAEQGLDQDMPGSMVDEDQIYFSADNLKALYETNPDKIDEMVTRIVTPMAEFGLLDTEWCTAGEDCSDYMYNVNATTAEHQDLAHTIAADSIQLLKNDESTLPLKANTTVAVVGSACEPTNDIAALLAVWNMGNYYAVGGSGRVIPSDPVSPVAGISARAPASGVTVLTSISDDEQAALDIMAQADVAIVCAGATTTESVDRDDLKVVEEDFVKAIASGSSTPTVVVTMAPGPLLMPWLDDVEASVNIFLGGAATGTAVADVLFGDVNPSGKSPVTFPLSEDDTVAPCFDVDCPYSEGLFVGYRALEDKDVAFPFGHGLSYTSFDYALSSGPTVGSDGSVTATVTITNTGAVAGAEVVQLYVGGLGGDSHPIKVLKGFEKVPLEAGESSDVSFELLSKDLSTFDKVSWAWVPYSGKMQLLVGSSSRDLRVTADFEI